MFKRKPVVLYCYAADFPRARDAIKAYAPDAVLEDTSGPGNVYPDTIDRYWTGKRDLIVIEQDIVIGENTIASLSECDQDWCTFAYQAPDAPGVLYCASLGCTKISRKMQKTYPFREMRERFPHMGWHYIDLAIRDAVWHDLDPHVHGEVEHLHDYPFLPSNADGILSPDETGGFYMLYDRETGELVKKMPVIRESIRPHKSSKIGK